MESAQLTQIDGSYLDKEFSHYVVLAQDLMRQMKSSEDRRICARYMTQCNKMKSDNLNIKYHRNRFFRYMLKTMKKTVENQAIQKDYFVHLVRNGMTIKKLITFSIFFHSINFNSF
jgi:hypothetical protein